MKKKKRKYNCGVCGEVFNTKTAIRRHKEEKHGGYFKKKEMKGGKEKMEEKIEEKKDLLVDYRKENRE